MSETNERNGTPDAFQASAAQPEQSRERAMQKVRETLLYGTLPGHDVSKDVFYHQGLEEKREQAAAVDTQEAERVRNQITITARPETAPPLRVSQAGTDSTGTRRTEPDVGQARNPAAEAVSMDVSNDQSPIEARRPRSLIDRIRSSRLAKPLAVAGSVAMLGAGALVGNKLFGSGKGGTTSAKAADSGKKFDNGGGLNELTVNANIETMMNRAERLTENQANAQLRDFARHTTYEQFQQMIDRLGAIDHEGNKMFANVDGNVDNSAEAKMRTLLPSIVDANNAWGYLEGLKGRGVVSGKPPFEQGSREHFEAARKVALRASGASVDLHEELDVSHLNEGIDGPEGVNTVSRESRTIEVTVMFVQLANGETAQVIFKENCWNVEEVTHGGRRVRLRVSGPGQPPTRHPRGKEVHPIGNGDSRNQPDPNGNSEKGFKGGPRKPGPGTSNGGSHGGVGPQPPGTNKDKDPSQSNPNGPKAPLGEGQGDGAPGKPPDETDPGYNGGA